VSTGTGFFKPILQYPATAGRCQRSVALEKVAGSSPVGHPLNLATHTFGSRAIETPTYLVPVRVSSSALYCSTILSPTCQERPIAYILKRAPSTSLIKGKKEGGGSTHPT